jgi:hypothetical protein
MVLSECALARLEDQNLHSAPFDVHQATFAVFPIHLVEHTSLDTGDSHRSLSGSETAEEACPSLIVLVASHTTPRQAAHS